MSSEKCDGLKEWLDKYGLAGYYDKFAALAEEEAATQVVDLAALPEDAFKDIIIKAIPKQKFHKAMEELKETVQASAAGSAANAIRQLSKEGDAEPTPRSYPAAGTEPDAPEEGMNFWFLPTDVIAQMPLDCPMPRHQTLRDEDKLIKRLVKWGEVLTGDLARDTASVSHRWITPEHPDPACAKLKKLQDVLANMPHIRYVWLDFACAPQWHGGGRTPEEEDEFRAILDNILPRLFLGTTVLSLYEQKYAQRFWPLVETWTATKMPTPKGLKPASKEKLRIHFIGMFSQEGREENVREYMMTGWHNKTADDACDILSQEDIDVTNQSDKETNLAVVMGLDARVRGLFVACPQAQAALQAQAQAAQPAQASAGSAVAAARAIRGGDNFQPLEEEEEEEDRWPVRLLPFSRLEEVAGGIETLLGVDEDEFALLTHGGLRAMRTEFEKHGSKDDKDNFTYIVDGIAQDEKWMPPQAKKDIEHKFYHGGPLEPGDYDMNHSGFTLKDFLETPDAKLANLKDSHVAALRLYTSSSYRMINNPLRSRMRPHPFAATVFFFTQGLKKLRTAQAAKLDPQAFAVESVLWRGIKDARIDLAKFREEGGGVELAPVSTNADRDVAVKYAASKSPLIMEYKVRGQTRGVSLNFLSIYPKENELVFPPGTFFAFEGVERQDGFTIVTVRPQMP